MNSSKATGLDNISAKFVSDRATQITPAFTRIVNLSIHNAVIPDEMKKARIVPLYKKGKRTCVGNYRPVSILPVLSKVIERVIYNQVEAYSREYIYELQSGFRTSYSTDTCLLYLNEYIKNEIDKGNQVGMLLLDLQKAFDTVQHTILLRKLKALGMSDHTVRWFESYLSNRSQLVNIDGTHSSFCPVNCGVPQGSILGPLLFTLYVNDMVVSVNCKLLLYADDSVLIVSGKDVEQIQYQLS